MRTISRALDSIFSAYYEPEPDEEQFGPYDTEQDWFRDYFGKSRWPAGDRHVSGVPREGGPDLEDHPDFDRAWAEGWRPSRTRDALVHPSGRVLSTTQSTVNGRSQPWYEEGLGEGRIHYRGHFSLADALGATKWEGAYPEPEDSANIIRDLKWLEEDRRR